MPVSLSKVLISSSFDLEMPIGEYNRQLLPESRSTQMGNPAWMICKYAMLWPCCSLFSFKALLYFRHLCYFSEIMFFKKLSALIALYFSFHSALFHSWRFISFMALLFFGKELLFKFF
jgi:hypothetical protein